MWKTYYTYLAAAFAVQVVTWIVGRLAWERWVAPLGQVISPEVAEGVFTPRVSGVIVVALAASAGLQIYFLVKACRALLRDRRAGRGAAPLSRD